MASKYLDLTGLSVYDASIKSYAQNLLKPSLISTATSSGNKFTFNNVNKQGLAIFSFGNCNTLINIYGLTNGTTYKQAGTFVYNSGGSVITTTINIRKNSSNQLEIWSGNSSYPIVNGFTGYLFILPLY